MPKKPPTPKRRNVYALTMRLRSAKAGAHRDRKKQARKRACRGRVRV